MQADWLPETRTLKAVLRESGSAAGTLEVGWEAGRYSGSTVRVVIDGKPAVAGQYRTKTMNGREVLSVEYAPRVTQCQ